MAIWQLIDIASLNGSLLEDAVSQANKIPISNLIRIVVYYDYFWKQIKDGDSR